jgi:hypothetical protein
MSKDVKIFVIAGVIVILCMTAVFAYAILLNAQWSSKVLIAMIICAGVVIIVPIVNFIYVRVKSSDSSGTEVELKIKRENVIAPILESNATTSTKRTEAVPVKVQNQGKAYVDVKNGESGKISTLTVKKIIDEINDSPPFQKDEIAQNYHGIKVNWEGTLWEVKKRFLESVSVPLHPEAKNVHYSIWFDVPVGKFPQLKIARRDDLIGVSGRIIKCSGPGMFVELDVDEIIFYEKT